MATIGHPYRLVTVRRSAVSIALDGALTLERTSPGLFSPAGHVVVALMRHV